MEQPTPEFVRVERQVFDEIVGEFTIIKEVNELQSQVIEKLVQRIKQLEEV